jgi:actin-related protein
MVVDGLLYLPSVRRLPFGGRDVTGHLQRLLAARGIVIDDLGTVQARTSKTQLPAHLCRSLIS